MGEWKADTETNKGKVISKLVFEVPNVNRQCTHGLEDRESNRIWKLIVLKNIEERIEFLEFCKLPKSLKDTPNFNKDIKSYTIIDLITNMELCRDGGDLHLQV